MSDERKHDGKAQERDSRDKRRVSPPGYPAVPHVGCHMSLLGRRDLLWVQRSAGRRRDTGYLVRG